MSGYETTGIAGRIDCRRVGFGALGSLPRRRRTVRRSDLPAKFTPSAYAVPSTKYSPFTTPDYYTYADDL